MVLVVCFNKANGKYDKGLFPRSKNDSLFMHTFIKVQHVCNKTLTNYCNYLFTLLAVRLHHYELRIDTSN